MTSWAKRWAGMNTAGHRASVGYLDRHARELLALFQDFSPTSVLDIGCGDGYLFEPLGFFKLRYKGVDFSESMLECFRQKYPGTDLTHHDGATYVDESKYDLIFSSQMIQYLDDDMFLQFLRNAKLMMHPESTLVVASTPCLPHRRGYLLGHLAPPWKQSVFRRLVSLARLVLPLQDPMGHWYRPSDLITMADSCGFTCQIYGSSEYLYRIHAVMRISGSSAQKSPTNADSKSDSRRVKD